VSSDSEERGRWWRRDCSGGEKWWWSRGAAAWVVNWHRWWRRCPWVEVRVWGLGGFVAGGLEEVEWGSQRRRKTSRRKPRSETAGTRNMPRKKETSVAHSPYRVIRHAIRELYSKVPDIPVMGKVVAIFMVS
jgi:hypothetical protein